jgi:hypothetical protein
MASEGRVGSSNPERSTSAEEARDGSVTLGLISAPDIPEKIARELAPELPGLLGKHVDDRVSWDVSVVVDPLTGTGRDAPDILDVCRERSQREGWDLAVCLTDLPVYRSEQPVVADASAQRGVGAISLPALGVTRLRPRAREATIQLVHELYARIPDLQPEPRGEDGDAEAGDGASGLPGRRPRHLVERRPAELVSPFRRIEPPDEDMKEAGVDARFAAPGVRGRLRLFSGMVLANRPWKILPPFKGAVAAAFATAAYALVLPTIWMLADAVGWARLLALMVAAIVAMVAWVIIGHHLWERPTDREDRRWAALYNGVTALTISVAVLVAYAVLFALVFLAAWVFVPGHYFQITLKHPIGVGDFLILAWMATSLATVAGAIGSSLEDEDTVRDASYGYRQRRRQESEEDDSDE